MLKKLQTLGTLLVQYARSSEAHGNPLLVRTQPRIWLHAMSWGSCQLPHFFPQSFSNSNTRCWSLEVTGGFYHGRLCGYLVEGVQSMSYLAWIIGCMCIVARRPNFKACSCILERIFDGPNWFGHTLAIVPRDGYRIFLNSALRVLDNQNLSPTMKSGLRCLTSWFSLTRICERCETFLAKSKHSNWSARNPSTI